MERVDDPLRCERLVVALPAALHLRPLPRTLWRFGAPQRDVAIVRACSVALDELPRREFRGRPYAGAPAPDLDLLLSSARAAHKRWDPLTTDEEIRAEILRRLDRDPWPFSALASDPA